MATYDFEEDATVSTFKGSDFYEMHKNDIFLTENTIVEHILCQGKKIRDKLKKLQPGQLLTLGSATIDAETPLTVKKGGGNTKINDNEYTLNRLTGMCAAYAAKQTGEYSPKCAMAIALGIRLTDDRKLYYSAAPGAEHFSEVFSYLPLLCAIKQLELQKVTKDNITRIAAVKTNDGKTLAALLELKKAEVPARLKKFGKGGAKGTIELQKAIQVAKSFGLAL